MKKYFTIAIVGAAMALGAPVIGSAQAVEGSNGSLGITIFSNFSSKTDKLETVAPATTSKVKTLGANVTRAYLTGKYNLNSAWSANVTVDVANESTLSHRNSVYLKYAYLKGAIYGDQMKISFGQLPTPWIDYQDAQQGHRYITKVMADRFGFDASSDLGVGLSGILGSGAISYGLSVTNGSGYTYGNVRTGNKGLDYDVRLSAAPLANAMLDLQYRYGYRGTKYTDALGTFAGVKSTLYQVQLTYDVAPLMKVGVGYLNNRDRAQDANGYTVNHGSSYTLAANGSELKSTGYYVWSSVALSNGVGLYATYEQLKNDTKVAGAPQEKIGRYLLAAEASPYENIKLALVYDNQVSKNLAGISGDKRTVSKIGLFTQAKF